MSSGRSLKARAIDLLSRREHSRSELQRKLARHAGDPAELEALLNELERDQWLSAPRFVESLVHRRAPVHGTARIMRELRQHGIPEDELSAWRETLHASELDRARAVWQKKFGASPVDARDYARQARFMAGRGFSGECLRRILGDPEA